MLKRAGSNLISLILLAGLTVGCSHATVADREVASAWPHWKTLSETKVRSFENIWVLSDVHGHYKKLKKLLVAAELIEDPVGEPTRWIKKPDGQKQLLIIVGDYITKGSKNIRVMKQLDELQKQAKADGSEILLLLGNNEIEFLAGDVDKEIKEETELEGSPKQEKETKENLAWLFKSKKDYEKKVSPKELARVSRMGKMFREMPVGAILGGKWLVTHSGFFNLKVDEDDSEADQRRKVQDYLKEIGETLSRAASHADGGNFNKAEELYGKLASDGDSFIFKHNWWENKENKRLGAGELEHNRNMLRLLRFETLLFGHDPEAFGIKGDIARTRDWDFVKLDTGMSDEEDRNGKILKCPVSQGLDIQACRQMNRKGDEMHLERPND